VHKLKKNIFTYFTFLSTSILSVALFFSFFNAISYSKELDVIIIFILFQFFVWSTFFALNKKLNIISVNIFIIVFLNLILTPLFYRITFDVPYRSPNNKTIIEYKQDYFKGMLTGTHVSTTDEKGYRTNKKINYKKKAENTLRVITIGASTVEQHNTDDNKTWSSLLVKNLSLNTNKDIELINMGMSGLRAKHHYISLKETKKYQPDLVVLILGLNDWNYHIQNRNKVFLFSYFEIQYDFRKSPLYKIYTKLNRQIIKSFKKKKLNSIKKKSITNLTNEEKLISFHKLVSDNINIRKKIETFYPKNVSHDYSFWMFEIFNECKKNKLNCIFADQPTAYKNSVSLKLKNRFWMTPPYQKYTLTLENLEKVSTLYNDWLKVNVSKNNLNFCLLSEYLEPNTDNFYDDAHFAENGSKKVAKILTNCLKTDSNFN